MSSADKYVLITESQNFGEEESDSKIKTVEESESAALRALEDQGIFIESTVDNPTQAKPREQFSRELLDQSGIEIVSNEEESPSL